MKDKKKDLEKEIEIFENEISFGLFNFLKKKKLNHKIEENNTKLVILMTKNHK